MQGRIAKEKRKINSNIFKHYPYALASDYYTSYASSGGGSDGEAEVDVDVEVEGNSTSWF